ncbi:MAG: hypothetical protein GEU79_09565 [Acidimicrobiia bacterium]|nr:hypothetical protein [Acidimicrobiia bacterium]
MSDRASLDSAQSEAQDNADATAPTTGGRRIRIPSLLGLVGLVVGLVFALFADGYQLFVLSLMCIFGVAAIGLNISLGWTGMLVFSGSAFFGVGALVSGRLINTGLPAELSILAAGVVGLVTAALYGAITVRLNRYYFAVTGIAIMAILHFVYQTFPAIGGGYSGFTVETPTLAVLGGAASKTPTTLYLVGLALLALTYIAVRRLETTPLGRGWRVVRQSASTAEALGINVWRSKVISFAISMAFVAVAGAWHVVVTARFLPESYMFTDLLFMFLILIVGGLGSINGMVLGAAFLVGVREYLRGFPGLSELIYGVVLLAVVLFFSQGIYGAVRRKLRSLREGVV